MWWFVSTRACRSAARRTSRNRSAGGTARSNGRARSSSRIRPSAASRSASGRPVRSDSCQGSGTSRCTTWMAWPLARCRNPARRLACRRSSAPAAVRSRAASRGPVRSSTIWAVYTSLSPVPVASVSAAPSRAWKSRPSCSGESGRTSSSPDVFMRGPSILLPSRRFRPGSARPGPGRTG